MTTSVLIFRSINLPTRSESDSADGLWWMCRLHYMRSRITSAAHEEIWRVGHVGQGSSRVHPREDVTSMLRGKRFSGI